MADCPSRHDHDDDDVAFYAEHGWWISPKVFSDDFIDAAERFYRGRDRTLPVEDGYLNWTEDDGFDVVHRYQRHAHPTADRSRMVDEQLCRVQPNGEPDFTDPDVFPTIWPVP